MQWVTVSKCVYVSSTSACDTKIYVNNCIYKSEGVSAENKYKIKKMWKKKKRENREKSK